MTERPPRPAPPRLAALAFAALALAAAGEASAGSNTAFSGTAYVDYWGMSSKELAKRSPTGVTIDAMIKMGVDVNDDLTFSASGDVATKPGYLLARLRHIAQDEEFAVNEDKTRVQRRRLGK